MRTKHLIKTFQFIEEHRARLDLTGGLRLNPKGRLELPRQTADDNRFDTTAGQWAATWVTNPAKVRAWVGFEAQITNKRNPNGDGTLVTGAGYRLSDGADEYWWDGASWVVNALNWNTEGEVANNIASFPVASRSLQVIVNLTSADDTLSPELTAIKVLWTSNIEHQEDYIYRSLIPALKENIRPIARTIVPQINDGVTLDFAAGLVDTPYDVVDIDSVFDNATDPDHFVDLLSSYNPNTRQITLNTSVAADVPLWVNFIYRPLVAHLTSRDYNEVNRVPALLIENVRIVNASVVGQDDTVMNKDAGEGVKVFGPRQGDIAMDLTCVAALAVDVVRLQEAIRNWMESNPLLRSRGMDEQFRLWLIDEGTHAGGSNPDDLSNGQLSVRIVGALFFERGSQQVYAVSAFQTSANSNFNLGN